MSGTVPLHATTTRRPGWTHPQVLLLCLALCAAFCIWPVAWSLGHGVMVVVVPNDDNRHEPYLPSHPSLQPLGPHTSLLHDTRIQQPAPPHPQQDTQTTNLVGQSTNVSHAHTGQTSSSSSPTTPLLTRRRIFYCGYPNLFDELHYNHADLLFPEYAPAVRWTNAHNQNITFTPHDILLRDLGGTCPYQPPYLSRHFPGKILTLNGESRTDHTPDGIQTFAMGPYQDTNATLGVPFAALSLANLPPHVQDQIYHATASSRGSLSSFHHHNHHTPPPRQERPHFVLYVASNCILFREQAFVDLSTIAPVHYCGKCRGLKGSTAAAAAAWRLAGQSNAAAAVNHHNDKNQTMSLPTPPTTTTTNEPHYHRIVRGNDCAASAGWTSNAALFRHYRFALVMENTHKPMYITEKIVNAFLGGTIPIWYGTTDIFEIFNRNAFVYWDVTNASSRAAALAQVQNLERNATAYEAMLAQPILAQGHATMERFFSFRDDVGGGKLRQRIRRLLGIL